MIHLEPCPFCGQELEQRHRRYNPYARCATDDCMGGKLPLISLDVPEDIERWNRRGREQALVALCEDAAAILERTANDTLDGRNMVRRLRGATDTSIARLKAEWQAEALERCAKGVAACKPGATPRGISIAIKMEAEELRRQAEEAP
jgi:hypothetical protein